MCIHHSESYEQQLLQLIAAVPELGETAKAAASLGMADFYIAGGAITQVVWNHIHGNALLHNVKDFDVVYFDDVCTVSETDYEQQLLQRLSHNIPVDVKNQATIHQVYERKFGFAISPYTQVEQGIDSWLSAFAIGFTMDTLGRARLYTPYGLDDAFNMVIKPNRQAMSQSSYQAMVSSYRQRWPQVTVTDWE